MSSRMSPSRLLVTRGAHRRLSKWRDSQRLVSQLGRLRGLLRFAGDSVRRVRRIRKALGKVWRGCVFDENKELVRRTPGALATLRDALHFLASAPHQDTSCPASFASAAVFALAALWSLCVRNDRNRMELRKLGTLEVCLRVLCALDDQTVCLFALLALCTFMESPYVLEELRSLGALRVLREELGRPPEENERLAELYDEAVERLQEAEEEHQRRHRRRGEGAQETEEEGLRGEE